MKEAFGRYKKALKSFMDSLLEDVEAKAEVEWQRWEAQGKPEEIKVWFVTWKVC